MKKMLQILVLVILVMLMPIVFNKLKKDEKTKKTEAARKAHIAAQAELERTVLTREKFEMVRRGMNLGDVVRTLGTEPAVVSDVFQLVDTSGNGKYPIASGVSYGMLRGQDGVELSLLQLSSGTREVYIFMVWDDGVDEACICFKANVHYDAVLGVMQPGKIFGYECKAQAGSWNGNPMAYFRWKSKTEQ